MENKSPSKYPKLENYSLGKQIGQGTFGKVLLGKHVLTGEKVAIKVLEKRMLVE